MPVPDTLEIRKALLEILRKGNPQSRTAKEWMSLAEKHLGITASMQPHESKEFKDRITESLQYLTDKHMISNPSRYTYMITKKGQNVLDSITETEDKQLDALTDDGALPDAMDLTGDDAEVMNDATDSTASPEIPDTPDTPADADQTSGLDTMPDAMDLTGDDAEVVNDAADSTASPENHDTPADADQTSGLDAMPDAMDLTSDELDVVDNSADTPITDDTTEFTDTLPASLNMTGDETEAANDSQNTPQLPDIPAYIDAEDTLDSDVHTLNSIDEVDPDMPKDDLPADDFSTTDTDDFSSAVNQALNIEDVFERHNSELADKVLMRAAGLSQEMFAVFVTDLLSKMGYNAFQTARYTSDSSGSSMIQGVILDPKAKNPIYIHADKLSPGRTVGRSDMHDFADELAEKGGTGIFATTGEFSEQAGIYAQDERIMLIDGKKLASLMLANNFCVNVAKVFEVKELDEDSFSEYE